MVLVAAKIVNGWGLHNIHQYTSHSSACAAAADRHAQAHLPNHKASISRQNSGDSADPPSFKYRAIITYIEPD